MPSEIALALANGIGVVGVVLLVGWLVMTGHLIPRRTHEREVAMMQESLEHREHEANEWRTEGRIKDQVIVEKLGRIEGVSTEGFSTLDSFLTSMQTARERANPNEDGVQA